MNPYSECPATKSPCDQDCPDPDCARLRFPEDFEVSAGICEECGGPADFEDADRVQCDCGTTVCSACCVAFAGESYCPGCAADHAAAKIQPSETP